MNRRDFFGAIARGIATAAAMAYCPKVVVNPGDGTVPPVKVHLTYVWKWHKRIPWRP